MPLSGGQLEPLRRAREEPDEAPGRGWLVHHTAAGGEVAVVNAMGRVFMNQLDSPFTKLDELLDGAADPLPPIRILDFHCEITSEKNAMGWYLDGRVTAVVGTHTHVPTADARVLPGGPAYITDGGMTGARTVTILGVGAAFLTARLLTSLLFAVSPTDLRGFQHQNRVMGAEAMSEGNDLNEVCALAQGGDACDVLRAWERRHRVVTPARDERVSTTRFVPIAMQKS